jgi:hypothetical protein
MLIAVIFLAIVFGVCFAARWLVGAATWDRCHPEDDNGAGQ